MVSWPKLIIVDSEMVCVCVFVHACALAVALWVEPLTTLGSPCSSVQQLTLCDEAASVARRAGLSWDW